MKIADRKESPIIGLTGMGGGLTSYILYGSSGSGGVYEISRSLRFKQNKHGLIFQELHQVQAILRRGPGVVG